MEGEQAMDEATTPLEILELMADNPDLPVIDEGLEDGKHPINPVGARIEDGKIIIKFE